MGRKKIELKPEQIKEVETLAAVLTVEQIADYFSISRKTFYNLMERNEEIFTHYKKGRAKAVQNIAQNLIKKAQNGDLGAQIFFLKTQAGWKDTSHIEHTSPDNSMTPAIVERIIIDIDQDDEDEVTHYDA